MQEPEPSNLISEQPWPAQQLRSSFRLNRATVSVLELARKIAHARGSDRVMPVHLLLALVEKTDTLAYRAMTDLGVKPGSIAGRLRAADVTNGGGLAALVDYDTRLIFNNAFKEAELLGHHRIDPIHLLLSLLYKDATTTKWRLEEEGLTLYDLRRYLSSQNAPQRQVRGLRRRSHDLDKAGLGVSPMFGLPIAAFAIGGVALWIGVPSVLLLPAGLLFLIGGWVTSVCIHEFAHAFTAYMGGDRSAGSRGYLRLNPLAYTHPLISIVLPVVFLVVGGFGLPGGAVYINRAALRSRRWESLVSAAGPAATLVFTFLIALPFFGGFYARFENPQNTRFFFALAFLVFIECAALIFNLIPIPPLDGFGIISPLLSYEMQARAAQLGMLGMLLVFFVLWQDNALSRAFWTGVSDLSSSVFQVSPYLPYAGEVTFLPWRFRA